MRLKGEEASDFRRSRIVDLSKQGKTQQAIAEVLGCSQAWVSKVLKQAKSGLPYTRKPRGKVALLTKEQFAQLAEHLKQGAIAHGFETDNWTRERVCVLIDQKFRVRYHPAHASNILSKIGFTRQKPKRKDYRRDAAENEAWLKEKLPAAQKKPGKKGG